MKKALFLSVLLLFAARSTPTAPGQYQAWGPDIDQMEILKTFHTADYDRVVLLPFDTTATPIPDKSDKSYDTVKSVLATYTFTLLESMKPELKAKLDVEQADKAPKTAKTIVIRGVVDAISPGSRAKRSMVGYGAGGATTTFHAEIVDAKTNTVLAKFTQTRRSGGTFKFYGGKDMDVMRDAIHASGKDLAHILDSF